MTSKRCLHESVSSVQYAGLTINCIGPHQARMTD